MQEGRVELLRPARNEVYERGFNESFWKLLSDCISRDQSARPRFKMIQEYLRSMKKAEPSTQLENLGKILPRTYFTIAHIFRLYARNSGQVFDRLEARNELDGNRFAYTASDQ